MCRVFGNLHTLNVNRSLVSCWSQVDRLKQLPQLTELRMTNTPILQVGTNVRSTVLFSFIYLCRSSLCFQIKYRIKNWFLILQIF